MHRASDADRAATANDPKGALIRLLDYLKPYRVQLVAVIVLVALYAILSIVGPYLMGVAIDDYIETKNTAGLMQIAVSWPPSPKKRCKKCARTCLPTCKSSL